MLLQPNEPFRRQMRFEFLHAIKDSLESGILFFLLCSMVGLHFQSSQSGGRMLYP